MLSNRMLRNLNDAVSGASLLETVCVNVGEQHVVHRKADDALINRLQCPGYREVILELDGDDLIREGLEEASEPSTHQLHTERSGLRS